MRPEAIFLDRDGTLIVDKAYLSDPAGVEFFPGVPEALRLIRGAGCRLFLFTNQSGIGRGYYTLEDAHRVNARLVERVGFHGELFEDICIAPESPEQPSVYRKPSPRFILETLARTGLTPGRCLMVGDSHADAGAALAAGIQAVALRTGLIDCLEHAFVVDNRIPVYEDLAAFARSVFG